jgi:hypothetical protein
LRETAAVAAAVQEMLKDCTTKDIHKQTGINPHSNAKKTDQEYPAIFCL